MCCQFLPSSPPIVQKMYWLTSYCFENRSRADVSPLNNEEIAMPAITMKRSDVLPRVVERR